jgi:hypothetical protein
MGQTPVIKVSMQRGGYNVLSTITAQGDMTYSIKEDTVNGKRYIEFLEELISNRDALPITLHFMALKKSERLCAHRGKLRIFFLPKRAPINPDEQVWNDRIGKQPIKNKAGVKRATRGHSVDYLITGDSDFRLYRSAPSDSAGQDRQRA